jgi:O-antigen/teichoic acid export membrane protein
LLLEALSGYIDRNWLSAITKKGINLVSNETEQHKESLKNGFFSREAVSGVPWMIISKLVLFFVYFGVSIIVVGSLGREKFGVLSLLTNLASYISVICGLGMTAALMRFIPELVVNKNKAGLIALLWKSAALQLLTVLAVSVLLWFGSDWLQQLFKADAVEHFRLYLMLSAIAIGLLLIKEFVVTTFTSIYKVSTVAILSTIHGVIWVSSLWIWLGIRPEITSVYFVQILCDILVYSFGLFLLINHIRKLNWRSPTFGIGKRRTLKFSGSVMINSLIRMMMYKYTEVFFLAYVGGTTVVGIYDLGYSLPSTIITFLPSSVLPLFTAGFAEAYVRDNDCLGKLISSFYKVLLMVSLPVAILGAFFSPTAYHIIYKGEMDEAGIIASAFCLVLTLPLISMPLSMAIKAKEKVLNTVPILVLQIIVNLILDWFLIVYLRLGVWGGILAVLGTFVLTIPVRLHVVRNIVGGIYFPTAFCARVCITLVIEGALFFWIAEATHLFTRLESNIINLLMLFVMGGIYLILFLLLVRLLRLVRQEDIEDFHALDIKRLNLILRFLVR